MQVGLDSAYFQAQYTKHPSCGLQARVGREVESRRHSTPQTGAESKRRIRSNFPFCLHSSQIVLGSTAALGTPGGISRPEPARTTEPARTGNKFASKIEETQLDKEVPSSMSQSTKTMVPVIVWSYLCWHTCLAQCGCTGSPKAA